MGLDAIIRSVLTTAHAVTADLQASVTHEAYSGLDAYAKPTFSSSVTRTALVESAQKLIRTDDGREVLSQSKVTFLQPVSLSTKDRITLPDGTTGPILKIEGLVDPSTSAPYLLEVWLG